MTLARRSFLRGAVATAAVALALPSLAKPYCRSVRVDTYTFVQGTHPVFAGEIGRYEAVRFVDGGPMLAQYQKRRARRIASQQGWRKPWKA